MRRCAFLVVALLVFLGNIGLPVYAHTCATAGDTFLSVGLHSDSCGAHEEPAEPAPPCCHKPKVENKHACCTETVGRLALSFHFVHLAKMQPVIAHTYSAAIPLIDGSDAQFPLELKTGISSNRPPPWSSVPHFLSSICTWRI